MCHLDAAADFGRLCYILNTPTTLIDLLADGLINPKTLSQIAGICGSQIQAIALATLGPILYAGKLIAEKDPSPEFRQAIFTAIQKQTTTVRTRDAIQAAITQVLTSHSIDFYP